MGLLGDLFIADAISKSNKSDNTQSGIINCSKIKSKIEKHKEWVATATEEEIEQHNKNSKAIMLLNELVEERYIEYLKYMENYKRNESLIEELGADKFNELLLLRAKNKELEEENKKLKEQQKVKRYIRRK